MQRLESQQQAHWSLTTFTSCVSPVPARQQCTALSSDMCPHIWHETLLLLNGQCQVVVQNISRQQGLQGHVCMCQPVSRAAGDGIGLI